jgi:hypothetical protein
VVERILGKAEVVSSILTGSTIFSFPKEKPRQSGVAELAVAKRRLAERALHLTRHQIADPDDSGHQKHGQDELKSEYHESFS